MFGRSPPVRAPCDVAPAVSTHEGDISQNKMNQHRPCGTSPLKGVSWCKPHNLWQAQIKKKGENYHLGFYKFEVDAAWAYDLAARELFGEYACLNFPDVGEQGVVFPDDIPKETFLSARVMFES